MLLNHDAGVLGQHWHEGVIVVVGVVVNVADATRCQRSEAVDAGVMRDINGGVLKAGTATGAVTNRIDFAVNNGLLMIVAHSADVRGSSNVAVVTHGDDAVIFNDDGTHAQARARAAHGC